MRNFILLFILSVITITVKAQSPQAINYQAVARDNSGNPLTNRNIGVRVGILSGSSTGTSVYSETHSVTTNQFGLFNIEIGRGVVQNGVFAQINWGSNTHFAKIDIDQNGGTNYQFVGTSQMLSVPYALYAENIAMLYEVNLKTDTVNLYQGDTINGLGYQYAPKPSYIAGEYEDLVMSHSTLPNGVSEILSYPVTFTSNMFQELIPYTYESEIWRLFANANSTPGYFPITFRATNSRGRIKSDKYILHILPCNIQTENGSVGIYKGTWSFPLTLNDTLTISNTIQNDGQIVFNSKTFNINFNATINGNYVNIPQTQNYPTLTFGTITATNVSFKGTGKFDCTNNTIKIELKFVTGTLSSGPITNLAGISLTGTFTK